MAYNPNIHHRHSIRLKEFDYSLPGYYSITICTYQKLLFFGKPVPPERDGKDLRKLYTLNEKGLLIQQQWLALDSRYTNIQLDAFSIMPDHMHGIMRVLATTGIQHASDMQSPIRAEQSPAPTSESADPPTIGDIVCAFKSITTKLCNQMDNTKERKIWHRNYYERIIRDNTELNKIRTYIHNNPINWKQDEHYLFYIKPDETE